MTYKTTSACEKGHKMFHIIHISKVNNNVYVCNYMTDRHVQGVGEAPIFCSGKCSAYHSK